MEQSNLYVDGGARGNPGPAACGIMINNPQGRTIFQGGYCIGKATNNVAEYTALLRGLQESCKLGIDRLDIYSDSQLMVRQITGQYRVRDISLQKLHDQAHQLLERFDRWQITHIPREKNEQANSLVNQALDAHKDITVVPPDPATATTHSGPAETSGKVVKPVKIVIIGGGSYAWSPTLLRDLVMQKELAGGGEVWLVDIDPKPLKDIDAYAKALLKRTKSKFTVHTTVDRDAALGGADFVIITISTGGFKAMRHDLEIPEKHGIYQPVGDTVGPGGISRTLRNVPVFVDLAKSFVKHCPDAWILNITNPMTVLTNTLALQGCRRVIGLCHELSALWTRLTDHFKCDWHDISMRVAGLNHFAFILDATYQGQSIMSQFDTWASEPDNQVQGGKIDLTHQESLSLEWHKFKYDFYRKTGRMLYPGDRHITEFFSNVITKQSGYGAAFGIKLTTIAHRQEWFDKARKDTLKWTAKPETIPLKISREAISAIVACLCSSRTVVDVVNLPNVGQIDNLPRGTVVETMATIGNGMVEPHAVGALPDDLAMMLSHHAHRFNLTLQAALKGDRKLALEAMLTDPLVGDCQTAGKLLDQLLSANRKLLPQFF